eukprot:GHVU01049347.1.p1 GENE.GHVU01049347.1~~GHVU01049347.1.p1  ORF type:complete len:251 (+),score=38.67 GHVU01049347.1:2-754(+)
MTLDARAVHCTSLILQAHVVGTEWLRLEHVWFVVVNKGMSEGFALTIGTDTANSLLAHQVRKFEHEALAEPFSLPPSAARVAMTEETNESGLTDESPETRLCRTRQSGFTESPEARRNDGFEAARMVRTVADPEREQEWEDFEPEEEVESDEEDEADLVPGTLAHSLKECNAKVHNRITEALDNGGFEDADIFNAMHELVDEITVWRDRLCADDKPAKVEPLKVQLKDPNDSIVLCPRPVGKMLDEAIKD